MPQQAHRPRIILTTFLTFLLLGFVGFVAIISALMDLRGSDAVRDGVLILGILSIYFLLFILFRSPRWLRLPLAATFAISAVMQFISIFTQASFGQGGEYSWLMGGGGAIFCTLLWYLVVHSEGKENVG